MCVVSYDKCSDDTGSGVPGKNATFSRFDTLHGLKPMALLHPLNPGVVFFENNSYAILTTNNRKMWQRDAPGMSSGSGL